MQTPQIYFLAGLGFDERIFSNLQIKNWEVKYLKWLEPEISESLDKYVQRMIQQIEPRNSPIILVGHSFGGIVVQEISKVIQTEKVILISSIKSKEEMPATLKFFKHIPLYNFFNKKLILKSFPIWARAFGYNSEKGRNLFVQMIGNCTDNYFKWSMDKIVNWNGNDSLENIVHIHGTRDKTFPINRIKNPIIIPDGSHFMVFSKADEVGGVLNKIIK